MFFDALNGLNDNETVTLIENTGIQFLDFEIDTTSKKPPKDQKKALEKFIGKWIPLPFFNTTLKSVGPIDWARVYITSPKAEETSVIEDIKGDSQDSQNSADESDSNSPSLYRVVFAFDTTTFYAQDLDALGNDYLSLTNKDVGVSEFRLSSADFSDDSKFKSFISDEVELVKKFLAKHADETGIDEDDCNNFYEQIITLLYEHIPHFRLKIAAQGNHTNSKVEVCLALDIGNSRTCGVLFENNTQANVNRDKLVAHSLQLRDLNQPEVCYEGPFPSRIEFSHVNFGYNIISNNPRAFVWPSLVRVGTEAEKLASKKAGNEGLTGLVSPKRFLWDNAVGVGEDRWKFNNFGRMSDPSLKEDVPATHSSFSPYINSRGTALFALDDEDCESMYMYADYSKRACSTFMVIEILLQALSQVNSFGYRDKTAEKNIAREITNILITTPTGMPYEEREVLRSVVTQAVGIVWKMYGYDYTEPNVFPGNKSDDELLSIVNNSQYYDGMPYVPYIKLPRVSSDWNEAESGQVVYLYNELVHIYSGDCIQFIESLRRSGVNNRLLEKESIEKVYEEHNEKVPKDSGFTPISTRIATIDVGGGTTDLVVKDYVFLHTRKSSEFNITPVEIFKDGFKVAGDDMMSDLIESCIMSQIATHLKGKFRDKLSVDAELSALIGNKATKDNIKRQVVRAGFMQEVLVVVAKRIMSFLEFMTDPFSPFTISGTVEQFITGVLTCFPKPVRSIELEKYEVNDKVLDYFNAPFKKVDSSFNLKDVELKFDINEIARIFVQGGRESNLSFKICGQLNKACELLNLLECDLVLITGRPSKMPMISWYLKQRLAIPSTRIVPMSSYDCDSWYPFTKLDDPKTTASVGALLSYMRMFNHNELVSFRLVTKPTPVVYDANYIGHLKNSLITEEGVVAKIVPSDKSRQIEAPERKDKDNSHSDSGVVFTTTFPFHIGYRKLEDADWPATPLYKLKVLEGENDLNSIRAMMKASDNIYAYDGSDGYVEFVNNLKAAHDDLKSYLTKYVSKHDLDTDFFNKLALEASNAIQKAVPEVKKEITSYSNFDLSAVFSKLSKDAENRRILMLQGHNDETEDADNSFVDSLEQVQDALTKALKTLLTRVLTSINDKLSSMSNKSVEVCLELSAKDKQYPVKFLSNLSGSFDKGSYVGQSNQLEILKLKSVILEYRDSRIDIKPFCELKLQTLGDLQIEYFMDIGVIDTSKCSRV